MKAMVAIPSVFGIFLDRMHAGSRTNNRVSLYDIGETATDCWLTRHVHPTSLTLLMEKFSAFRVR